MSMQFWNMHSGTDSKLCYMSHTRLHCRKWTYCPTNFFNSTITSWKVECLMQNPFTWNLMFLKCLKKMHRDFTVVNFLGPATHTYQRLLHYATKERVQSVKQWMCKSMGHEFINPCMHGSSYKRRKHIQPSNEKNPNLLTLISYRSENCCGGKIPGIPIFSS